MNCDFIPNALTTVRAIRLAFIAIALLIVLAGVNAPSSAQPPIRPTQPVQPVAIPGDVPGLGQTTQSSQPQTDSAQADKEWLTAYFMVHHGYKLQHMPAIEVTLNKMTPTQLHTLREMYDQKHSMMMQQQATFTHWNAQQVARAQAYDQQQTRQLNQVSSEETQAANLQEQQINQMHQEAAANAENKSMSYPGMYGPYGGAYGGGYGIRPYFNPYAN